MRKELSWRIFLIGVLAFFMAVSILFFIGVPESNYYETYESRIDIWGYLTLFLGIWMIGAIFFLKENDEYFDKEDLILLAPGAWLLLDAILCFLREEHGRNPYLWFVLTVAVLAGLMMLLFLNSATGSFWKKLLCYLGLALVALLLWCLRSYNALDVLLSWVCAGVILLITLLGTLLLFIIPAKW